MNETMVTVTGNVAGDVVARRVGANEEHMLVTFRVASSERRWDKASEAWVDGDRFTAQVNCWRRVAEGARLLTKGDPVVVTGRLSVREFEVDGVRRYMTEISANAVGPDLARCEAKVYPRRARGEGDAAVRTEDGGISGPAEPGSAVGTGEGDGVGVAVPGVEFPRVETPLEEVRPDTEDAPSEGATVTGIGASERRRSGAARASA